MRYLILGGTRFVGRHIARAALDEGHEVTVFTRGVTNPGLFPEAEHLTGDRDRDLGALRGREWDRVIDVSGYVPGAVEASARLLREACEHYTFVSSISVYLRWEGVGEESETAAPAGRGEALTPESYGALKVACEEAVRGVFGTRALVVRPGILVGPHDPSERFTYWVARVAQGGDVAVPGDPARRVQILDARDLAEWLVWMAMRRRPGIYNAVGPEYRLTFGRLLERIRTVTGARAAFHWVPDDKIDDEVAPRLPLWARGEEGRPAHMEVEALRARWEGLLFRPLAETIADTLTWERGRGDASALEVGPGPEAERDLVGRAERRT